MAEMKGGAMATYYLRERRAAAGAGPSAARRRRKSRAPILRSIAVVLAGWSMASCSAHIDSFVVDSATVTNENQATATFPGPINLDTYCFPEDRPNFAEDQKKTSCDEPAFKKATKKANKFAENGASEVAAVAATSAAAKPNEKMAIYYRNRLQAAVMERSDQICRYHQAAIIANSAAFNFVTGWTATILSGVSAVMGGEAAKSALSAASAMVGAGRAEFNAEFYQNYFAAAIVKKIRDVRTIRKAAIEDKRDDDTFKYTVEEALRDANDYHYTCSFFEGVIAITAEKRDILTQGEIKKQIDDLTFENTALDTQILELEKTITGLEKKLKTEAAKPTKDTAAIVAKERELTEKKRERAEKKEQLLFNNMLLSRLRAQRTWAPNS